MLLTHHLATISDRQLLLRQPVLNFEKAGGGEQNQWQLFPVNQPADLKKDFLISCKLTFNNAGNFSAGLAWGFKYTSVGTLNRLIISPATGIWQAVHLLQKKQLTIYAERGRVALHHPNFTRLAILHLQGNFHFYVGDIHKPVYQCNAGDMPMAGNGLAICSLGNDAGIINDLSVWQLTTRPCNRLSIAALLDIAEPRGIALVG